MIDKLARAASNTLNPFVLSFIILVLFSFHSTGDTASALRWSAVSVALSVLPIFILVLLLVRTKKLDGLFVNTRRQRTLIYILALALAVIATLILVVYQAPKLLRVTFVAGLVAIIIFMIINIFWKISLHTAFMSASVAVLIITYGGIAAWTLLLLPPVGWARIQLRQHTPMQVITGGLLSASIVVLIFHCFNMINW